jgi:NitT/TauT family transport system permease protein
MASTDQLAELEAGLDELERPVIPTTTARRRVLRSVIPPLITLGVFLLVWHVAAANDVFGKGDEALPSPGAMLDAAKDQWSQGRIQEAVFTSLRRGGLGFLASMVVGSAIGLAMSSNRLVRAAIGPYISGLQSLPSVAWVPFAIVWWGISSPAIYFVVLMGAVPSIANGLVAGIDQIPPLYLRVGRVLGARGLSSARHVVLPAALPGYLAGLKQGWAFSWRSLMAAEIIARSDALGLGLGSFLNEGRDLSDMALVVTGILVMLTVGVAVELLVFAPVERRVLRRRGLTPGTAV